jgi:hypothetical protein
MASAAMPPIAERGTAVKIKRAYFIELKVKNSSSMIRDRATGMATDKRFLAWLRFSNWPPYDM